MEVLATLERGAPEELLLKLGSPMKCLNTLFRGTGDYCEGTAVPQLKEEDRGTPARRPGARALN